MKILITGGAGFIGSHIAYACLAAGHEVHILDDLSTGKMENIPAGAVFHHLDLRSPEAAALATREKFDVINHHAAQMDVRKSVADPCFDANTNIIGTLNLLQAAQQAGTRKVIFASSGGTVYGEQDYFPADEAHPLRPLSPYGVAKASVEMYLYFYQMQYGMKNVIFRYPNIYGPRQNPHGEAGVVAIFAMKMMAGEQPVINGDGLQTRDYVMVADVVKANMLALDEHFDGVYNLGTSVETNVVQIYDAVNAYCGNKLPRKFGEAKPGEQRRSVLSAAKLTSATGWKPDYDFSSGMKVTLDWFAGK